MCVGEGRGGEEAKLMQVFGLDFLSSCVGFALTHSNINYTLIHVKISYRLM